MPFVKGAEKRIANFDNVDQRVTVSEGNFETAAYVSFTEAIAMQTVSTYADITGVTPGSVLDEKLKAHFAQNNQNTIVFGEAAPATPDITLDKLDIEKFFYLVTDELVPTTIKTIVAWASANQKFYTATPNITTTVADLVTEFTPTTDELFLLVPSKNDQSAEARVIGFFAPQTIGIYAWFNNILNGGVDGGFSTAEFILLDDLFSTYMARMKGNIAIAEGVTKANKDADFVVAKYYVKDIIEVDVTQYLLSAPKPSMATDRSTVKAVIKKRTDLLEEQGVLVEGFTEIFIPEYEDIPENDRISGSLKNVKVNFRYDNGIKTVDGTLFWS